MDVGLWIWAVFVAGVLAVLLVDLLVFHRDAHQVTLREAGIWTAVWFLLALGFAGVVWLWHGPGAATAYTTGFLIERSLSIDNLFVLVVLFAYFAVPPQYRHRALLVGVLGALVLRAIFIAGGAVALERFTWTVYVLGAFLIATGVRLAVREVEPAPGRNVVVRGLRRLVPMTDRFHGQRFFVHVDGRRFATPMLAVLAAVATTDVAFAADSIPAIFAVTDEPFLVFAANAFSVLGMLALYFLLEGAMGRFRYLRVALAAILMLVGAKMTLSGVVHPPVVVSLAVILAILAVAAAASYLADRRTPTSWSSGVEGCARRPRRRRPGGAGSADALREKGAGKSVSSAPNGVARRPDRADCVGRSVCLRRSGLRTGLAERPVRDPGRHVVGVRSRDARAAAGDVQAARRPPRPLHVAVERDRRATAEEPDLAP